MIGEAPNPGIFSEKVKSQCSLRLPLGNLNLWLSNPILSDIPLPESLKNACAKRKLQFLAGRACARDALAQEGCTGVFEIGIGKRGEPIWPTGFIGSISHMDDYVSAVTAKRSILGGIGLDMEKIMDSELAQKIAPQIVTPGELNIFSELRTQLSKEEFLTLCFSAKESLYKCLSSLTQKTLGFLDFEITAIVPSEEMFCASIRKGILHSCHDWREFPGRFRFEGNRIFTSSEILSKDGHL